MPSLDFAEKQRIQRSNQIFLRLRKSYTTATHNLPKKTFGKRYKVLDG